MFCWNLCYDLTLKSECLINIRFWLLFNFQTAGGFRESIIFFSFLIFLDCELWFLILDCLGFAIIHVWFLLVKISLDFFFWWFLDRVIFAVGFERLVFLRGVFSLIFKMSNQSKHPSTNSRYSNTSHPISNSL